MHAVALETAFPALQPDQGAFGNCCRPPRILLSRLLHPHPTVPVVLAQLKAVLVALALLRAAPVVLAQPRAEAEALLDLLSRQSFLAAMARSTT